MVFLHYYLYLQTNSNLALITSYLKQVAEKKENKKKSVGYLLRHDYSAATLKPLQLKGIDRYVYDLLYLKDQKKFTEELEVVLKPVRVLVYFPVDFDGEGTNEVVITLCCLLLIELLAEDEKEYERKTSINYGEGVYGRDCCESWNIYELRNFNPIAGWSRDEGEADWGTSTLLV